MGIFFRTTLLTALCCVFCISAKAQQYTLKDSLAIDSIMLNAMHAYYTDIDLSLEYTQQALRLSKKAGYQKGVCEAYNGLGIIYRSMGMTDSSEYYTSINIPARFELKTLDDSLGAYVDMLNLANIYSGRGQIVEALKICFESLEYGNRVKDTQLMVISRSALARLYLKCDEAKRARPYFDEMIEIVRDLPYQQAKVELGSAYLSISKCYIVEKLYDEAEVYLDSAKRVFIKIGDSLDLMSTYITYMEMYNSKKELSKALPYIKTVLTASKKDGNVYQNALAAYYMCRYYSQNNQLDSAISYGNICEEGAVSTQNTELQELVYFELAELLTQQKDFEKATAYYKQHIVLKDSLHSESLYRTLQAQVFENELKKAEQEKQNALIENESKAETIRFWKIAGSILIIAIIITIVLGIRLNNSRKKYLSAVKSLSHNNQVKNRLLAIISHDLRSPLSSLHGVVALTKQKALSEEDKERLFNKVEQNLNVTLSLVDNLLYWTKNQINEIEAHIEPFDIEKIISSTIDVYGPQAKEKSISVNINLSAHTNVLGDKGMINIVIRNLVSNAVKFTKSGGVIDIITKTNGNKLEVKVSDTGLGIKPEKIDGLFTDLNKSELGTNKEKGTGLGLPVSYEFIKLNHSKLKIDSTLGQGTTFYFDLPLHN